MSRLFFLTLLAAISLIANGEIYKWTDSAGKVHFSDHQPGNAKVEKVHVQINSYTNVTYQLPPQTTAPAAQTNKKVVMYSTTWCGYCKKARAYFEANNIPYTDYDVESSAEGKQNYAAMGGQGVPIIFVGQTRMNGFSPEGFKSLYQ